MGIQNWSEDIILVSLAPEPQLGEELQETYEIIQDSTGKDVVVDFADVDIITSSSIAKLLRLRKALVDSGNKLIFCAVSPKTKNIFSVTGLDSVFDFVDDQFVALAGLQMAAG